MDATEAVGAIVILLAIGGCAGRLGGPALPASAPTAPTPRTKLIEEITHALAHEDHAEAAAAIERARRAPVGEQPSAELVAYFDATVHAYEGDMPGAAKVMYDHIAKVGSTASAAFNFHDAMIALRTADGDLLGALVEAEEMTRAGVLGRWKSSDPDRVTLVMLKEHWHRAYLLRMIAQTIAGAERDAFIGYAQSARRDYVEVAAPLN